MKEKILVLGIVVIFLVLVSTYLISGDDIVTEPAEFGKWGTKITLNYKDGTSDVLTNSLDQLNIFQKDDKDIESIQYGLYSKATSNKLQEYKIDASDLIISWIIGDWSAYQDSAGAGPHKSQFVEKTFPISGEWDTIIEITRDTQSLSLDRFDPGTYTFKLRPQGELRYKPVNGGDWKTTTLPSGVSVQIEIVDDTTFNIDFSEGVDYTTQEYWTWELYQNKDNVVSFTQEQINDCNSDSPEDVFASLIADGAGEFWVFEQSTWLNWNSADSGGTLMEIQPDVDYYVSDLDGDYTLRIPKS